MTSMISNDVKQYIFFTVVGTIALLGLWYIFIKAPQARTRLLEPWAKKRGLAFQPPISLGSHTTGHETSGLHGVVQGVALTLRSSRLVNSRRAGVHGTTEIFLRALAPAPVSFSVSMEPRRAPGSIPTGDPTFDASVSVRSDQPHAALAWLNPQLRAAVYALIVSGTPIACVYQSGEVALRLGEPISEEAGLDRALAVALAAAHAPLIGATR